MGVMVVSLQVQICAASRHPINHSQGLDELAIATEWAWERRRAPTGRDGTSTTYWE